MPRRKRSTFGTIERLSGRDHWNLKWWETRDGVHRRRSRVVWGTRREAERELAKIRAGLDETERGARQSLHARVTVGEAYERWWLPRLEERHAAGEVADQTVAQYASTWRKHVSPRWADVRVTDVTPPDIQAWLVPPKGGPGERMTKKPASDSLMLLRGVLDSAVRYGHLSVNVARNRYEMPQAGRSYPRGVYTIEQMDELVRALSGTVAQIPVLLCGFGSCRTGESLGPLLSEVSFARRHGMLLAVIEINRQNRPDRRVSERLKNEWSPRVVAIPEPWSLILMDHVERALAAGDTYLSDDGLGRPVTQDAVRKAWYAVFREPLSTSPERHQLRCLRSSWETMMNWRQGVPHTKIEKMLGHVGEGVTGRHYDRPQAEFFIETVAEAFAEHPFRDFSGTLSQS